MYPLLRHTCSSSVCVTVLSLKLYHSPVKSSQKCQKTIHQSQCCSMKAFIEKYQNFVALTNPKRIILTTSVHYHIAHIWTKCNLFLEKPQCYHRKIFFSVLIKYPTTTLIYKEKEQGTLAKGLRYNPDVENQLQYIFSHGFMMLNQKCLPSADGICLQFILKLEPYSIREV